MLNNLRQEEKLTPLFQIHFTNSISNTLDPNDVVVNNITELEKLIFCIGRNSNIIFDEQAKFAHPDIYSLCAAQKYDEIIKELVCDFKEPQEAVDILKKIPLLEYIPHIIGPNPQPIPKEYVHKNYNENVFISTSERVGNLFYFQGFPDIPEIQTDHESDHFDGIKIFEVARQASIAAMALKGFPLDAVNILTKNTISFKRFIDKTEAYYIQTLPAVQPNGGYIYCAFIIFQNYQACAYGYFAGIGYTEKSKYIKIRKGGSEKK